MCIILFILYSSFGFAQNDEAFVDSLVSQKMAELEMQSNPEYFFRKDYCDGSIKMFTLPGGKLCTSKSTYYSVYVFWKEDEQLQLQKFDNCGSYVPLKIQDSKLLKNVISMKDALKSEEIKSYKPENETSLFANMSVKSCHKEYNFNLLGSSFEKEITEFDVSNDPEYKNKNAKYNNSLSLMKLDDEISKLVKNLEDKGKFYREK